MQCWTHFEVDFGSLNINGSLNVIGIQQAKNIWSKKESSTRKLQIWSSLFLTLVLLEIFLVKFTMKVDLTPHIKLGFIRQLIICLFLPSLSHFFFSYTNCSNSNQRF
jgi:hypothetical protein